MSLTYTIVQIGTNRVAEEREERMVLPKYSSPPNLFNDLI
jgi:hypothetical protein